MTEPQPAAKRIKRHPPPLDDVETFLRRFVAFPSESAAVAVTLWAAHAHVVHGGENSPRLALLSPEPGSGKTRVLEVLELLVPRPLSTVQCKCGSDLPQRLPPADASDG